MINETEAQRIQYLQQDVHRINQTIAKMDRVFGAQLESITVNLRKLCENAGIEMLRKRPCDACQGAGKVFKTEPWKDPRESKDCTPGSAIERPSTPCMDCDTIGTIWK